MVQDKTVSILILAGVALLICGYIGTSPNCPSPFGLPGDPCPTVDCEDDNVRAMCDLSIYRSANVGTGRPCCYIL